VRYAAARALARIQPGHGGTVDQVLAALDGDTDYQDELAAALREFAPAIAARALGARFDRGDAKTKLGSIALPPAAVAAIEAGHAAVVGRPGRGVGVEIHPPPFFLV